MLFLPVRLAPVILTFAPLFSQRVWPHAQTLLIGVILAPGQRTVTSCLRIVGWGGERRFVNYHRVLNRVRWSSRTASRLWLGLLVRSFAPSGPLVLGLDDTIERRRGKRISALGIYRDPVRSSDSHFVKASGLRWLSLLLLAPVPWAGRVWALPFLTWHGSVADAPAECAVVCAALAGGGDLCRSTGVSRRRNPTAVGGSGDYPCDSLLIGLVPYRHAAGRAPRARRQAAGTNRGLVWQGTGDLLGYAGGGTPSFRALGFSEIARQEQDRKIAPWCDSLFTGGYLLRCVMAKVKLTYNSEIADIWGTITGQSRIKGITLPIVDGLIAATAIHHKLTLVTRNIKDFAAWNVPLLNPWEAE